MGGTPKRSLSVLCEARTNEFVHATHPAVSWETRRAAVLPAEGDEAISIPGWELASLRSQ